MAYGKQPLSAANVGGWRRQAAATESSKEKMRARKPYVGSRFSNRYWPSEAPELIRLIPGEYNVQLPVELENGKYGVVTNKLVYYNCGQHFDAYTHKSSICSGGPLFANKTHAQPCIPCRAYFTSPKKADGRRECRFGFRSDLYVFTVLDYLPYVKVEQVDATGLVRLNDKTGEPYTEWIRKGTRDADILDEKLGHIMHWPVYYKDFHKLMEYDAAINSSCRSCGARDSISRLALICKQCGNAIIECAQTSVQAQAQDKMLETSVVCPHCKHSAPPEEYLDCSNCENPIRATIFDVDITVSKSNVKNSEITISKYSAPHAIDPSYKAQPLDLVALYAPDSIEAQEQRFGVSFEDYVNLD